MWNAPPVAPLVPPVPLPEPDIQLTRSGVMGPGSGPTQGYPSRLRLRSPGLAAAGSAGAWTGATNTAVTTGTVTGDPVNNTVASVTGPLFEAIGTETNPLLFNC